MRIDTRPDLSPLQPTPRLSPSYTAATPTPSVLSAIEDTLDLSSQGRNLPATFQSLGPKDKNAYLQNLARLLNAGIVGTETLLVRGRSYHSFVSTRFADPEITHARIQR